MKTFVALISIFCLSVISCGKQPQTAPSASTDSVMNSGTMLSDTTTIYSDTTTIQTDTTSIRMDSMNTHR